MGTEPRTATKTSDTTLTTRPGRPEDARALYELSIRAIRNSATDHYDADQLEAWVGRRSVEQHAWLISHTETVVAVVGNTIAGFASLALDEVGHLVGGEVDQLFVAPEFDGRGAARLLLLTVEAEAHEAGVSELVTHASWRAAPVFERLGYQQIEVEHVAIDEQLLTRVRMSKHLASTPERRRPSEIVSS